MSEKITVYQSVHKSISASENGELELEIWMDGFVNRNAEFRRRPWSDPVFAGPKCGVH